ncbi:MAG: 5-formyltetrahydrofolate cyclo-ligase [Erysipelotrichaceae bacterium]|nr:5-formyltetrahydrofolate cyclo-ligase [Erysipelotrichaceae bacterium]
MTDKNELRKTILKKRNALSENEIKERSKIICEKLLPYLKDKMILSYYPFESEVDVSEINGSFKVAYPVVYGGKYLDAFVPENDVFIPNEYGINEPDPDDSLLVDSSDIEVIIVPLVAFDRNKNRLGYGKGYYDRYLNDYEGLKIGVAFSEQETDTIETEKNDVQLDIIITDKDIIS